MTNNKPSTHQNSEGYEWSDSGTARAEPRLKRSQIPPELPSENADASTYSLNKPKEPPEFVSNAQTPPSPPELHEIPTLVNRHSTSNEPAKKLSDYLIEKKYHPVMVFGDSGSGKSSLLASLLHYMQHDPNAGAICMLGDWILPTGTPEGDTFAEQASEFFHRDIMAFNDGQAAPATRVEVPFYIPVVVRPNSGKADTRLAFLESRGEDYRIDEGSVGYFPEIKRQIKDVYESFPGPISLIIISPFTYRDVYTTQDDLEDENARIREGDKALYGALQAYQKARQYPEMDNYMFVLTKWDMYTKGVSAPEFISPPRGLAEKMIRDRYPLAWNLFRNMPKTNSAKAMQYSAGLIAGNGVLAAPDQFKPAIYQFPRALWNWLYCNSTGGTTLYGETTQPKSGGLLSWLKKTLS